MELHKVDRIYLFLQWYWLQNGPFEAIDSQSVTVHEVQLSKDIQLQPMRIMLHLCKYWRWLFLGGYAVHVLVVLMYNLYDLQNRLQLLQSAQASDGYILSCMR